MIIGQGDVHIERICDTEASADAKDVMLARGSSSNHSHILRGGVLIDRDGRKLIDVPQDTQIVVVGEEWRHGPLDVPSGLYVLVDSQLEYTPEAIVQSQD